jgi:hypothetical protein
MKALVAAVVITAGLGHVAHADKTAAAPISDSHFRFKIPAGWKDKSPGGNPNVYTVAVDDPHNLVYQAKVQLGGAPANDEMLERYAEEARKSVTARLPDSKFKVIERGMKTIDEESAARFVFEMIPPGGKDPIRQLQFYVASGQEHAVLTFTAPAEHFKEYLKLFEETAQATKIIKQ